jgi:hypothetical protein
MRRVIHGGVLLAPALMLAGFALMGCGGGDVPKGDDALARRKLAVIAVLYGDYLQTHNNVPPKDEAAFRSFLTEQNDSRLKEYNVTNLDDLFISPRDGQKFAVVFGKRLAPPDAPGTPWAAYEQTGVDGKRLATQVRGATEELSPDQFSAQFPSK